MRLTVSTRRLMARTALGRFLLENDVSFRDGARAVGVSHPALRAWALGIGRPEDDAVRLKIARWTSDAVPIDAWITPADTKALAEAETVEPFRPSGTDG